MSSPGVADAASSEQMERKIAARTAKVGIIGMGYVGLPLALLYTEQKFTVTGFDIDKRKWTSWTLAARTSSASCLPRSRARARKASRPPRITPASPTWTPSSSASPRR